tara:strand:- start:227 stop:424 length:198 start_codon:yes stop_codon:yes gene_type:complete
VIKRKYFASAQRHNIDGKGSFNYHWFTFDYYSLFPSPDKVVSEVSKRLGIRYEGKEYQLIALNRI